MTSKSSDFKAGSILGETYMGLISAGLTKDEARKLLASIAATKQQEQQMSVFDFLRMVQEVNKDDPKCRNNWS